MQVDVKNRLAGTGIAVHHQPVARLRDAFLTSKRAGGKRHLAEQPGIRGREIVEGAYMFARHYKNMHGRLGMDIAEGDQVFGLHHHVGLDGALRHFAEQAIVHAGFLQADGRFSAIPGVR